MKCQVVRYSRSKRFLKTQTLTHLTIFTCVTYTLLISFLKYILIKYQMLDFKIAQKSGQSPCTIIIQGLGPNFIKIDKVRILHFYNFF